MGAIAFIFLVTVGVSVFFGAANIGLTQLMSKLEKIPTPTPFSIPTIYPTSIPTPTPIIQIKKVYVYPTTISTPIVTQVIKIYRPCQI